MMPLWIYMLSSHFLQDYHPEANITIPYWKIVSSLLTMVIPLIIGVMLARWKPHWQEKAKKVISLYLFSSEHLK